MPCSSATTTVPMSSAERSIPDTANEILLLALFDVACHRRSYSGPERSEYLLERYVVDFIRAVSTVTCIA